MRTMIVGALVFQLGHDFSAMEISGEMMRASMDLTRVSIGPRLFSHGNWDLVSTHPEIGDLFQLGHDFSAMEMMPLLGLIEKSLSSFNWATTFQPWK